MSGGGGPADVAKMFESAYDRLLANARRLMGHEPSGHTLEPAALLHEVYVRLVRSPALDWRTATHFECLAGRSMRRVLVDHAKAARRKKRGGPAVRVTFAEDLLPAADGTSLDMLALSDAIDRLTAVDRRSAEVLELRLFAGLGLREAADVLGIGHDTARDDWTHARAWLIRELRR